MFKERNSALLVVTDEDKVAVREGANILSEGKFQSDIDSIVDWFHRQPHFPDVDLDRDLVERIFISRRGSTESTKQKLDMLLAAKSLVPELASPRDIYHPDIQKNFSAMIFTPLPKLNNDRTRVNLYRYTDDVESYDFLFFLNYVFMKAYGISLRAIHIINAPSFLNAIINLAKSCLSSKLSSRIHVHANYEELYCHIDRNILPVEYGGQEMPAIELVESWKKEFEKPSIREYMLQQEMLRSDESKRIGPSLDLTVFGVASSHRALEID